MTELPMLTKTTYRLDVYATSDTALGDMRQPFMQLRRDTLVELSNWISHYDSFFHVDTKLFKITTTYREQEEEIIQ